MDAKSFYEAVGKDEVERVAIAAGTTLDYFRQIMYGNRLPSHRLVKDLEVASGYRMTRHDLRPDIFGEIPNQEAAASKVA